MPVFLTSRRGASLLVAALSAALLLPPLALGHTPGAVRSGGDPGGDLNTAPVPPHPLASTARKGSNLIRLAVGAFDPVNESPPSLLPLVDDTAAPRGRTAYWLVQAEAGAIPEAAEAIMTSGALIANAIPERSWTVRATPEQRETFAASPAIRWSGLYQPGWKMPPRSKTTPGLLDLEGEQNYRVFIFHREPEPASARAAVASVPGAEVVETSQRAMMVRATRAQLPAIASVAAVEWIGLKPESVPLNRNARWVTDTGIRDVYAATAPGRLTGAGQTAAVADTAINYITDRQGNAQYYFRDCERDSVNCKLASYVQQVPGNNFEDNMDKVVATGSGHRKMAAYFDIGESGTDPPDAGSHGSHVSGSVTGDSGPYGSWQRADGMAPGARLVHQNIVTPSGGLSLPADTYDLLAQAYRPRDPSSVIQNPDAEERATEKNAYKPREDGRTHNNSYGLIVPLIDLADAERMDEFVWDHEDMAVVVSAGNSGPEPGTIGSPATAKNIFSSAASVNGRQPMSSIDSLAIFSSHGPTSDGQYGPTVATPGQIVVSAKGGAAEEQHTLQGTSMSGPVLTGLATLVRQYFWDGWGPSEGEGFGVGIRNLARRHNPSAALVKAAVINGAARMRGAYTGDDGTNPDLDGQWPSAGQGFGLVNLDNSLFFKGDDLNNWYVDVWRDDEDAFEFPSGPATRTYELDVEAGKPLDVTLAYTDAPTGLAGLPVGQSVVVNNLDLEVTAPDGTTYVGNNFNTRIDPGAEEAASLPGDLPRDTTNVEERVRLPEPEPGTYTVTVRLSDALSDGPQGFALAASGKLADAPARGAGLLPDKPGRPEVSRIRVQRRSSDTAWVRWRTDEPTTGSVLVTGSETVRYVDSYNVGHDGFRGMDTGPQGPEDEGIETSEEYGDKPVLGTRHEAFLTGLKPGKTYALAISAIDRAGNRVRQEGPLLRTGRGVFGPAAADIGQLYEDGSWWGDDYSRNSGLATQLYSGRLDAATGALGAFMFRLPKSVDPAQITGAAVQLQSHHDITQTYLDDARYVVDLLDESVEPEWGTQDYEQIREAKALARLNPTMADRLGGTVPYTYSFDCRQVGQLRNTLDTVAGGERRAAFRSLGLSAFNESLFSYEFGFNRRSRGPTNRPRLLLFYAAGRGQTDPEACNADTPRPTISRVRVAPLGPRTGAVVSWMTNVASDSTVLFREQGTDDWVQVSAPLRTTHHMVEVRNLDPKKDYEFAVRSRACNGRTTTDTNGGSGYLFFPPPRDFTGFATYEFEPDAEGWTTESQSTGAAQHWEHGSPGHESSNGWHLRPYFDEQDERLISPELTIPGSGTRTVSVRFWNERDTEPGFDFLNVEWKVPDENWVHAAAFDGFTEDWVQDEAVFDAPAGPLQVRFRFKSDAFVSFPPYTGVSVDDVSIGTLSGTGDTGPKRLTEGFPPLSSDAAGMAPPPTRARPTSADRRHGTATCAPTTGFMSDTARRPREPEKRDQPRQRPKTQPPSVAGEQQEGAGLAVTGAQVLTLVLLAVALVTSGVLLVAARRRSPWDTPPSE